MRVCFVCIVSVAGVTCLPSDLLSIAFFLSFFLTSPFQEVRVKCVNQAFTCGMVNCSGLGVEAVYTTGQAGAGLSSAQVGLGLLRLHLQFGLESEV